MSLRNEITKQSPHARVKNFSEVSLGLDEVKAQREASRCLQCKQPLCVKGCPVEIDIPAFIRLLKESKPREALEKIKEKNNLPAVCGRVCPQENQCEATCILGKKGATINIGALERYAADQGVSRKQQVTGNRSQVKKVSTKIAVVGSGPAGLTAAADLAKMGYQVTIFESLHIAGGVLSYGIPEFRLPKRIVAEEVSYIESLGVEIKTGFLIGRIYSLQELFGQGFRALFLGLGAGLPQFLNIPGENLNRVYSANEFLTRVNLMKAYLFPQYATPLHIGRKVAVVGAGNVAFDCARSAIRLGAEVALVYRRSRTEMPARQEEILNAEEEGLRMELLTQPVKVLSDPEGAVKGLECIRMKLGEPDGSGRRRPLPVENSHFILDVDTLVVAIGQTPNPLLTKATPELAVNPDGTIKVDGDYTTSLSGVFAGGDIVTGADTVISAMGAGKKAGRAIDRYLKSKKLKVKSQKD